MLRPHHPRGFTLIEVVLSTVMMLIVGGAVYRLLTITQRLARAQTDQLSVQTNVRGAALVVVSELRELSAVEGGSTAENDIVSIASNAITYRAMRGFGFACQAPSATQISVNRNGLSSYRDPQAGRDSAYVFLQEGLQPGANAAWLPVAIAHVATGTACPGAGGPSLTLTVPSTPALAGVVAGTPVRIFEIMELRLYRSEGRSWLGLRSVSSGEAIQPLAGPFSDADGIRLESLDVNGLATSAVSQVKSIRLTLRGVGEGPSSSPGGDGPPVKQELTAQIALRNALR
jgi:prepilin-type N-terminal cleavage/methylation domain-containing protein